MKLKQRLIFTAAVVICSLVSMTCVIYYYAESYMSDNSIILSTSDIREKMKLKLLEKDRMRPFKRKLSKKFWTDSNSSYYDSNRAVEVELNDTEYEELAKKRDFLIR